LRQVSTVKNGGDAGVTGFALAYRFIRPSNSLVTVPQKVVSIR